uniref:Uncharacterized protein n=2 Tax=Phaeomonas parva TaxID=124430 RepID=A0A7S1UMK2_9STRA|mmetsp:Transcript_9306/g.27336  ORF Transcript_9306/g.27336 Transcript_9306/m.27336 type:complete len:186 (+) Transcript_9306:173-730(+)
MDAEGGRVWRMDALGQTFECHAAAEGQGARAVKERLEAHLSGDASEGKEWFPTDAVAAAKEKVANADADAECVCLTALALRLLQDACADAGGGAAKGEKDGAGEAETDDKPTAEKRKPRRRRPRPAVEPFVFEWDAGAFDVAYVAPGSGKVCLMSATERREALGVAEALFKDWGKTPGDADEASG